MTDFNHRKLLTCSNDKTLFRKELYNIVNSMDSENRFDFLAYCYEHYSDKYPDVLLEVFYPETEKRNGKKV